MILGGKSNRTVDVDRGLQKDGETNRMINWDEPKGDGDGQESYNHKGTSVGRLKTQDM